MLDSSMVLNGLASSLALDQQTINNREEEKEGKGGGERDLWTTRSEKETGQDLDRRLSFMLAEEPIKLKQVDAEPRFRNVYSTSLALVPFSLLLSSSSLPFVY